MTLVQKGFQTSTAESNHKPEHSDRVLSGHTPGPWLRCGDHGLVVYALHDNGFGFWKDGKRELVNRFYLYVEPCERQGGSLEEAICNARLIAAAPDLLDALRECLTCEFAVTDKAAIAKAEAAIRLAQTGGGQP